MKTSTLLGIASQIENALGVRSRATVKEMAQMVDRVAGHCRTKAQAAEVLAVERYDSAPGESSAVSDLIASFRK